MKIVRWTAVGAPDQKVLPLRAHGSRPCFMTLLTLISVFIFDLELSSRNNSRDPELVSESRYAGSTFSIRKALSPVNLWLSC